MTSQIACNNRWLKKRRLKNRWLAEPAQLEAVAPYVNVPRLIVDTTFYSESTRLTRHLFLDHIFFNAANRRHDVLLRVVRLGVPPRGPMFVRCLHRSLGIFRPMFAHLLAHVLGHVLGHVLWQRGHAPTAGAPDPDAGDRHYV